MKPLTKTTANSKLEKPSTNCPRFYAHPRRGKPDYLVTMEAI